MIPDETFYELWINLDLGLSKLEEIEKKMGKLLAPNLVESNLQGKLGKKLKIDSMSLMTWKKKLVMDNDAYHEFIKKISKDWGATLAEIDGDTEFLSAIVKKLDAGISRVDVSLLANARWIRSKSEYEPLIVTDDSDLLASAHAFSSFFGLSLGCLSVFELLRLTKVEEPLAKCCEYFNIDKGVAGIDHAWSKTDLEKSITNVLKKGKLACHVNRKILGLAKR